MKIKYQIKNRATGLSFKKVYQSYKWALRRVTLLNANDDWQGNYRIEEVGA